GPRERQHRRRQRGKRVGEQVAAEHGGQRAQDHFAGMAPARGWTFRGCLDRGLGRHDVSVVFAATRAYWSARSEPVADGQRRTARRGVVALLPVQAGDVLLVGEVVEVQVLYPDVACMVASLLYEPCIS